MLTSPPSQLALKTSAVDVVAGVKDALSAILHS